MDYPTPWAATASESFLATPEETRAGLEGAGFEVLELRDATEAVKAYGARSKAAIERGEKMPHRAVQLIHGVNAMEAMRHSSRGGGEGRRVPREVLCRKKAEPA